MPEFMLPLPESYIVKTNPHDGNKGLYYDKFCDRWHHNGKNWSLETYQENNGTRDPKLEWIKKISETSCGSTEEITQFATRQKKLIETFNGVYRIYKTNGRFVSGLGRSHPVENGFAWHPTLGTPYLPGSSFKGLVRSWAESSFEEATIDPDSFHRIFGSESRTIPRSGPRSQNCQSLQGSVIFLDAAPVKPVRLTMEIMTPHYSPYNTGNAPPSDWHKPSPIPFLTVADGQSLQFAVIPKNHTHAEDLELVLNWLDKALTYLGAGAKTSAGYGTFTHDENFELQSKQEDQSRRKRESDEEILKSAIAGKSQIYAELKTQTVLSAWESNKDAFVTPGIIEAWLEKLERSPDPESIAFFKELIDLHFTPDLLRNPEKVKGKQNKPVFRPRQIHIAIRLNDLLNQCSLH